MASNKLYMWTMEGKEEVATNVIYFAISRDGKNVCFEKDGITYLYNGTKKEFESNEVVSIGEDLKEIYYKQGSKMYVYKAGKSKFITDGIQEVYASFNSGMYYLNNDSKLCWYDNKVHVLDKVTISHLLAIAQSGPTVIFTDKAGDAYVARGKDVKRADVFDGVDWYRLNQFSGMRSLPSSTIMNSPCFNRYCSKLSSSKVSLNNTSASSCGTPFFSSEIGSTVGLGVGVGVGSGVGALVAVSVGSGVSFGLLSFTSHAVKTRAITNKSVKRKANNFRFITRPPFILYV
jgi:hypothetical protein